MGVTFEWASGGENMTAKEKRKLEKLEGGWQASEKLWVYGLKETSFLKINIFFPLHE